MLAFAKNRFSRAQDAAINKNTQLAQQRSASSRCVNRPCAAQLVRFKTFSRLSEKPRVDTWFSRSSTCSSDGEAWMHLDK